MKRFISRALLGVSLAVSLVSAQAPQTASLAIEGGTLIDGNGGAPVADSLVLIRGNRITAVGRKGQLAVPADARVINATGKFVLPGLWESQTAYSWYFGEAMPNHGITSSIDVGTEAEVAVPHRDAVLHGKDLAPRAFTGILRIGSTLNGATGYEGPLHTIRVPKSAEDTREVVWTVLNAGADYVIFYDGAMPFDWYKAGVEEAHKMGKPAFVRAYGPGIFPAQAAEIGAAQLAHSAGSALAVAKNPSQFRQGRDDRNELDKYADMDDAKAADLINALVAHHVSLVPTFFINYRGYPNDWAEFRAEAHEWYKDANLQKYYPKEPMEASLAAYDDVDTGPIVEALPWVVALMKARPGGGPAQEGASAAGVPDPARSPQPAIHTIAPFLVTQGTTPVTITLKGVNFVRRSVVQFKGKPVPTKVASPTELEFTLDADAMKAAGRFDLVVINPSPVDTSFSRGMWGNGTSNTAHLVVNYRY